MFKRIAVICILLLFTYASASQAAGIGLILGELSKQASKAAASEIGKTAVDWFKNLFNKDKKIARNYGKPQLNDGEVKGNERIWSLSPKGNLSESDIREIAKTLKSLDGNRSQSIHVRNNNKDQIIRESQSGIMAQSVNQQGRDNTIVAIGGDYVAGNKEEHYHIDANPDVDKAMADIHQTNRRCLDAAVAFTNKRLEDLDNRLQELYMEKSGAPSEEAKKWAKDIMNTEEFKKRREKEAEVIKEYNEEKAKKLLAYVYKAFIYIFQEIDSNVAAFLEINQKIKYEKDKRFFLFRNESNSLDHYIARSLFLPNGNRILISCNTGTMSKGLVITCPSMKFIEMVGGKVMQSFEIKPNYGLGGAAHRLGEGPVQYKEQPVVGNIQYNAGGNIDPLTDEFKNLLNTHLEAFFKIAFAR
jgi:hypothetical protein